MLQDHMLSRHVLDTEITMESYEYLLRSTP